MENPFAFYVEMIDTDAFNQAESGFPIGPNDAPFFPLFAPWLISGPVLTFAPLTESVFIFVGELSILLSLSAYTAGMIFYYRRVRKHREELGVPPPSALDGS